MHVCMSPHDIHYVSLCFCIQVLMHVCMSPHVIHYVSLCNCKYLPGTVGRMCRMEPKTLICKKQTASQHNAVGVITTSPFGLVTAHVSVPRSKNASLRRQAFSEVACVYCESVAQNVTLDLTSFCPKFHSRSFSNR